MSKKLVKVRYLTTARGPRYRHDEGQVAEVELDHARRLVRDEIAEALDPADLEQKAEKEKPPEPPPTEPETAELKPTEKAVAPPQERVGPRRRPADHDEPGRASKKG